MKVLDQEDMVKSYSQLASPQAIVEFVFLTEENAQHSTHLISPDQVRASCASNNLRVSPVSNTEPNVEPIYIVLSDVMFLGLKHILDQ